MTTSSPLEIKVVYDASKRRGRGTIVRPSPVRPPRRARSGVLVVSLLNVVVAGGMYYATWWRVDPFLYITMMKKTPIDVPSDIGTSGFFVAPPSPTQTAPGENAQSIPQTEPASPVWSGKTAQVVIPAAAYGWLTLATVGACALALAGGAGLGAAGGRMLRLIGVVLTLGLVAALAYAAFKVWSEYHLAYKPDHLRMGIGGVTLLITTVGMAVAGRVRGLIRLAAVTVILAGAASAVGVWLWSQCGALEPAQASVMIIALVFVAHSAWGWLLWPLARRM